MPNPTPRKKTLEDDLYWFYNSSTASITGITSNVHAVPYEAHQWVPEDVDLDDISRERLIRARLMQLPPRVRSVLSARYTHEANREPGLERYGPLLGVCRLALTRPELALLDDAAAEDLTAKALEAVTTATKMFGKVKAQ